MLRTFSQNKIYARPSQARRRTRSSSSSLQGFGRHETLPLLLRQAEHRSSVFLSKKADLDRSGNHLRPRNLENLRLLFPSNRSTANLMSLTKSETSSPVFIFQTIRIEIIEATSFASSGPAKMRTPSFSSEAVPVSLQIEEHQQCTNRRAPFIHHCTKGKYTFCNTTICRKNIKPSRKKRRGKKKRHCLSLARSLEASLPP